MDHTLADVALIIRAITRSCNLLYMEVSLSDCLAEPEPRFKDFIMSEYILPSLFELSSENGLHLISVQVLAASSKARG